MIHKVRALFNAFKNIDLLITVLVLFTFGWLVGNHIVFGPLRCNSVTYSWDEKSLHSCHLLSVTFYQLNCRPDFLSNSLTLFLTEFEFEEIIRSTVISMRFIFKAMVMKIIDSGPCGRRSKGTQSKIIKTHFNR